jgi:hypothetical protein
MPVGRRRAPVVLSAPFEADLVVHLRADLPRHRLTSPNGGKVPAVRLGQTVGPRNVGGTRNGEPRDRQEPDRGVGQKDRYEGQRPDRCAKPKVKLAQLSTCAVIPV